MKQLIILAGCLMLPHAASAQTLSVEEFEAYVLGKTLFYGAEGEDPYGAEQYLPNRRVRWSFLDGRCLEGEYYQQDEQICFVYEDDPTTHCWTFETRGGGLVATIGDEETSPLYEITNSTDRLMCLGPDVGV
ncbi:hypothetical protein [Nereida sp. MMG025]|uniref:hypothetical protein n=1 Tax=Nereida sp. MMG025 TaxID=2909981 RepID=UPI001F384079|nr:hypothetical protein [Nereida sp. MMG025]MCF6443807.1 hypothetical protein [Nereida sp. MMG025]